jgi:hypothetical protein
VADLSLAFQLGATCVPCSEGCDDIDARAPVVLLASLQSLQAAKRLLLAGDAYIM